MALEQYGSDSMDNPPKIVGMMFGSELNLFVMSPDLLQEMYISKNNYYDKLPAM